MKMLFGEEKIKLIIRWILGLVFIAAGIMKLTDPDVLAENLKAVPVFPDVLSAPAVYAFSIIEILLGAVLIVRLNNRILTVYLALVMVFCIYLGFKIFINDPSSCGCMGKTLVQTNTQSLIQDIFLLMGGAWLYE